MRPLAVVVTLAALVGGLAACGQKDGDAKSPTDEGIRKFDFANAEVRLGTGGKYQLKDGDHTEKGYEGTDVGLHLVSAPKFADVDGDADLDAAVVYEWIPAAGAPTMSAYVWTWDGKRAEQVAYPIRGGNDGKLSGLKAKKDGFTITAVSRPYNAPASEQDGERETFTFALEKGFPVQTDPGFGSVDRCVIHDGDPPGAVGDGTAPRVAPESDAPRIGKDGEFDSIHTVASVFNTEEWTLARAERSDGSIGCGWIKTDEATQG